jgi:hypothetical protein
MLRSLETYLDDFEVTIYGQKKPEWLTNVNFIQIYRWYPEYALKHWKGNKHYENYFDVLNKLFLAANNVDLPDNFVWAYDDIILLRKPKKEEIEQIVAVCKETKKRKRKWGRTINQSIDILNSKSLSNYMYESHLPRIFNKAALLDMFSEYNFRRMEIPYAPSTLYYNLHYHTPDIVINKTPEQKIKAGFYGRAAEDFASYEVDTKDDFDKAIKDKLWINYNNFGLQEVSLLGRYILKDFITETYNKKSRFEK